MELSESRDTFPKLLVANAERSPNQTALREKEFGIWQSFSWREYHDRVRDFSLGLLELGLRRGDAVAIIGDNRPEWVYSELAAQALGGAAVGLYQDSNLSEVAYVIDHCDASIVVAEDQEQVDKVLGMIEKLPKVKRVIYTDPRGLRDYRHPALLNFESVTECGRKLANAKPELWPECVRLGKTDDLALICYTSGTTGFPKGAMLSFRNLLLMALSLHEVDPKRQGDEFISFLPLAWIGEQMMSLSTALSIGFTVNFPEEPETAMENIREIGPQVMFAPPRIWENLASSVQVKMMDASPFKRFVYNSLMPVGYKVAEYRFKRQAIPLRWRILYKLAQVGLFRALRDRLGLSFVRSGSTGGAALGPDVFRFFHGIGVLLKQIYGQTEISGISCIHREGDVQFGTVGMPIPGTEVMVSEEGEILSRSKSIFSGYYKNQKATAETIIDGWLHSGDAGYFDKDGHLVVIDRLKDVLRLADGTQFSPQFIENRLKFSPYVKEAVVFGKGRPYLTAVLCIDMGIVGKWAEKRRTSYTTYTDLSSKLEVYGLIENEVKKVNETLPEAARIRKFVLLYKELDADDEELTRTRKVRRRFVEERYADIVSALYGDAPQVAIDTTIKFQDGRSTRIQTELAVRAVGAGIR